MRTGKTSFAFLVALTSGLVLLAAWVLLRPNGATVAVESEAAPVSVNAPPRGEGSTVALRAAPSVASVSEEMDVAAIEDLREIADEVDSSELDARAVDLEAGFELCALMESEDRQQRLAALSRLPAFREDSPPVESAEDEEETDDLAQRVVYAVMTAALKDEDEDVRNAAFAALNALPDEERDMLSLQIMGNDDAVLKEALLRSSRASSRRSSLALNIHGLESDDPAIVQLASENLLAATGRTFENAEQAYEWLEEEARKEESGEDTGNGDEIEIEFSDKDEVEVHNDKI